MSQIWLTSNSHYGHKSISGKKLSSWDSGYRIFDSVEEMDSVLINTFNKYIQPNDIVYHMGDFAWRDAKKYKDQLACQNIHLILGNHDKEIRKKINFFQEIFLSVEEYKEFNLGKVKMCLSHYSHQVWNKSHNGAFHFFGHSHDSIKGIGKSMDVGVDVAYRLYGEYRPFKIEEAMNLVKDKKHTVIDHHHQI